MSTPQITTPMLSPQSMADLLCTLVVLCRGENARGNPFWAYMCIKPSMAATFHEACRGTFNLEDYGTIIEYGESEDVPETVRQRMEHYYGADHHYEKTLLKAVDKLQNQYLPA